MLGAYGDANPTSGATAYDIGYPDGLANARMYAQPDTAEGLAPDGLYLGNEDRGDWPAASASLAYLRGEFAHVGGQAGSEHRNGWSDGLRKYDRNIHHFTGRYVRFIRRDVSKDGGPVGRSNYAGKLASGVNQQFSADMPSLEDIARGFTGRE